MTTTELLDRIQRKSLAAYRIYNRVVRTPINWEKERERLRRNPASRAEWKYAVPEHLGRLKQELKLLGTRLEGNKIPCKSSLYDPFTMHVVNATLKTALVKIGILEKLKTQSLRSTIALRSDFFGLDYDYASLEHAYQMLRKKITVRRTGQELARQSFSVFETAGMLKDALREMKKEIKKAITLPLLYEKDVLRAFTASIEVKDDPSFSMRCVTDPQTLVTRIFLSKGRRYSRPLAKIAFLHEFCGHALEMALFDRTLVKKCVLSSLFGYAGVSSPNIFDVKAEVFADLMVKPFVTKGEMRYVKFRRDVWLVCRAMADYLYHIKGRTIQEVMSVYEQVGLGPFAFDEAIMAPIFVDGYQGMYLFANRAIEEKREKLKLKEKDFLTLLLLMGKIPLSKFDEFAERVIKGKCLTNTNVLV